MSRQFHPPVSSPLKVLFICTGNICRSPTAEGLLQAQIDALGLQGRLATDSAGLVRHHIGELPDPRTRATAAARGLVLTHRARAVAPEDFTRFDLLLGMAQEHVTALKQRAPTPEAARRVLLFSTFDASPGTAGQDVPDPYYGGQEAFEDTFDRCASGVEGLLRAIERAGFQPEALRSAG